jgi:hypothetical protein
MPDRMRVSSDRSSREELLEGEDDEDEDEGEGECEGDSVEEKVAYRVQSDNRISLESDEDEDGRINEDSATEEYQELLEEFKSLKEEKTKLGKRQF